jgi:hypothetical protein
MRRLLIVVALVAASFAFHSALFLLGLRRIDPVIYVASPASSAGMYPHAQLKLSGTGIATWVIVTALFSIAVGALLKRAFVRPWWLYALSLFIVSLLYLIISHPHFLWVAFSPGAREALGSFLRENVTPLYDYYFGNGFYRFRLVLPFVYALLMYLLLPAGGLRRSATPALASTH